ncbi:MAG: hypothetical protein QG555_420 [Thermodesulfobacteriota bacterium]|nr:hypothetical protein [Thermodesulfobacteriota bacterium]
MIAVRMSTGEMSDKLLKILDNASLPAGAEAAWFIGEKDACLIAGSGFVPG